MTPSQPFIFLYGPPGSGKSTLGSLLSEALGLPFTDLDAEIEARQGKRIPEIFAAQGEPAFRRAEQEALEAVCRSPGERVVALGGGALLAPANRALAEARGRILLLHAPAERLAARLARPASGGPRPLLGTPQETRRRLETLLAARRAHYASFPLRLEASPPPQELLWQALAALGRFRLQGMGAPYEARLLPGGLDAAGEHFRRLRLRGPVALVTDENVAPHHAPRTLASLRRAGYAAEALTLPAGEEHKTPETLARLWAFFLASGVERGSTVAALGGGVVGDLTGFAAATFLRGVAWVNFPTSLLAMADASLGGKTGADLPQGKNLIGAFHAPRLVLADPETLSTLPAVEFRSGMAEVIKHAVIGDTALFARLRRGGSPARMREMLGRVLAVKVRIIEADPYEKGRRAALNFGHTLGHAIETASGYRLRHGEAVAIGMVAETRLAERLGIAEAGLAEEIATALRAWGLPVAIPPEMDPAALEALMQYDKKKRGGVVHFSLPARLGEVRTGITIDEETFPLREIL